MKPITVPSGEYLIVDVPEDALRIRTVQRSGPDWLIYLTPYNISGLPNKGNRFYKHYIDLPPGEWELLGRESEISEEVAATIVEKDYFDGIGYQFANYSLSHKWTFGKRYNTALESLTSLSKREGMNNPIWLKKK